MLIVSTTSRFSTIYQAWSINLNCCKKPAIQDQIDLDQYEDLQVVSFMSRQCYYNSHKGA